MAKLLNTEVLKEYNILKLLIRKMIDNNKVNNALQLIKTASSIAYHLNFTLVDNELELMCFELGEIILHKKVYKITDKKSEQIIFYDCFGYDNRGLTQQYIRALFANNIPFIYILNSDIKNFTKSKIYNELKLNSLAKISILDNKLNLTDKVIELHKLITINKCSKIFMHMSPNDAVGVTVFSRLKETIRYQINLTDHAFWLGVSVVDYNIEFREYGRSLSIKCRGIFSEKELYLPFYPLINTEIPFQGFPFEKDDEKVLILTGGSLYKFYGDDDTFFNLAFELLDENPEVILMVAGDGNKVPFQKFIKDHKYEKRIYLLGNRIDLSALMDEVDIYIGSYPICGGLMSQYAVNSNKPIVQYTRKELPINIIDTLFPFKNKDVTATYFSKNEFIEEVSILINSVNARDLKSNAFCNSLMTDIKFNKRFLDIFNLDDNSYFNNKCVDYDIDTKIITEIYFDQENNYLKTYTSIFIRNNLFILLRYLPCFTVKFIYKNVDVLLNNKFVLFKYKLKKVFFLLKNSIDKKL